jgi:hypothetical protein
MAKVHTIDGVQYREVARKVRYGDQYIVPLDDHFDITEGKPYKVTGIDPDGDPEFNDDAGDPRACLLDGEYVVLEPVGAADLSALESELAAMKAKVAEIERQLAEAKAADRLKVGDYAKVVNPTAGFSTKGQIVKITEDDGTTIPFNTEGLDGKYTGWYLEESLVRATDEEVAEAFKAAEEAKRKLEREKKITLELTKEEFGTIIAGFAKSNNGARNDYGDANGIFTLGNATKEHALFRRLKEMYYVS